MHTDRHETDCGQTNLTLAIGNKLSCFLTEKPFCRIETNQKNICTLQL